MAGVSPFGGSVGSGNGAPALFFDPNAFPAAVAGVARAFDTMETITQLVPPLSVDPRAFVTTSVAWHPPMSVDPTSAFGAVSAAWLAFHQAWSAEVTTGRSALEEMVKTLPVTAKAIVHADQQGSP